MICGKKLYHVKVDRKSFLRCTMHLGDLFLKINYQGKVFNDYILKTTMIHFLKISK